MNRQDWQRVYKPKGDALDIRVRNTLAALDDAPARRVAPRRALALALAAVLVLASTAAVAAGLLRSQAYNAKRAASQALEEVYGITREMESLFAVSVRETEEGSVVTYAPHLHEEQIGVYTVALCDGQATAAWSYDGETVTEGFASPVWGAAQLAEAVSRRGSGEEWYQILATTAPAQATVTREEALTLARQAIEDKYGENALEGYDEESAWLYEPAFRDFALSYDVGFQRVEDDERIGSFSVGIDAQSGEPYLVSWHGDPRYAILPQGDLSAYADAAAEFVRREGFEPLSAQEAFIAAQRYRDAGLEDLLEEDYADPSLAVSDKEAALATARTSLAERYGLTRALCELFTERTVLVSEEGRVVYKLTLTPGSDTFDARESVSFDGPDGTPQEAAFADRIGVYTATVDAVTGEVARTQWTHDGETADVPAQVWGRSPIYDAACLAQLCELLQAREAIRAHYGAIPERYPAFIEEEAALDALMVEAGFSAANYRCAAPAQGEITYEQMLSCAKEALIADEGLSEADFDAALAAEENIDVNCYRMGGKTLWELRFWCNGGTYAVVINAADGAIEDVIFDNGAGGNG